MALALMAKLYKIDVGTGLKKHDEILKVKTHTPCLWFKVLTIREKTFDFGHYNRLNMVTSE